jgi:hypothetical protein
MRTQRSFDRRIPVSGTGSAFPHGFTRTIQEGSMTAAKPAQRIEWIPIDRITVVNPRHRNKRVFKEIVENIATIGLKRPITVTRRAEAEGPFYDLVCGQGRLEA